MNVIVDSRETEKRKKRAKKIFKEIEIRQLECGDYVYENKVAVELKTANDFINSVKSKRIYKQAIKMAETYEKHYIIVYGNMQSAIKQSQYLGHYFSVSHWIGSLSSLSQTTQILQVSNETQAFKLMDSLFKKSSDNKNRFIIKPDYNEDENKIIGIVMYLGGMNSSKATELIKKFEIDNLSDLLKLSKKDIESVKGIGFKTSAKLMRWLK